LHGVDGVDFGRHHGTVKITRAPSSAEPASTAPEQTALEYRLDGTVATALKFIIEYLIVDVGPGRFDNYNIVLMLFGRYRWKA